MFGIPLTSGYVPRHRARRRRERWSASLAVALVLTVGCAPGAPWTDAGPGSGQGDATAPDAPDALPDVVDTRGVNAWIAPDVEASARLHRVDDEHMVAILALTNHGERTQLWTHLADGFGRPGGSDHDYPWGFFSGIAWLDEAEPVLHKPYHRADRSCLCSVQDDTGPFLSQGETQELYAVLPAPPKDATALTLITHLTLPLVNVPVHGGAPDGLDYPRPADHPDAEPEIAPLQAVIDSPTETVVTDTDTTQLHLSTDVLFAVNEAALTDAATQVLQRTAERIDAADADAVVIEGHADATGTDAVNDPLSKDRADAVHAALVDLVTTDTAFTTHGHGSRQPITDNDTDEGQRRNRRVTITIPAKSPATPTPQPTEPDPPARTGRPAPGITVPGPASNIEDREVDITLTGLRALTPDTALLSYTLTNPNADTVNVDLHTASDAWQEFRYRAAHAITLHDPTSDHTAHPLRVASLDHTDDGRHHRPHCLCTSSSGIDLSSTRLAPDQTREYYALLPLPTVNTTTADVTIGLAPAMENVAIQP